MAKRDLLAELMQGVSEIEQQRHGKVTLSKVAVETKPVPIVTAE